MITELLMLNKQELKTLQQGVEKLKYALQQDLNTRKDLAPQIRKVVEESIELQIKLLCYIDAKIQNIERQE